MGLSGELEDRRSRRENMASTPMASNTINRWIRILPLERGMKKTSKAGDGPRERSPSIESRDYCQDF